MSELSRLRGSEGYGACADEFRGVCGAFTGCMPVFPCRWVFGYGCGLFGGSGGVLLQNGKDSGAVKIVAQLAGGNGLCPVRREVG